MNMINDVKHFGIINGHVPFLLFDVYDINENGLISPILWCLEGEFRLISEAVIENLRANAEMYAKLSNKSIHPKLQIFWSQGIPVDNKVGRVLMGE